MHTEPYQFSFPMEVIKPVYTRITKKCIAVSINICPWQDPMQFGIKVPGKPCGTPGCRWDEANLWVGKVTRWIKCFPQHTKLHHCSYWSMSFLQHILSLLAIAIIHVGIIRIFLLIDIHQIMFSHTPWYKALKVCRCVICKHLSTLSPSLVTDSRILATHSFAIGHCYNSCWHY